MVERVKVLGNPYPICMIGPARKGWFFLRLKAINLNVLWGNGKNIGLIIRTEVQN